MPRTKKATVESELPTEMQEQLAALVPTEPEVNETFVKLQDNLNNALAKAEEELKRIDERAEFAISVVSQAIRTRAAVEKGRVLLSIKETFSSVPEFEGKFHEWMSLAGIAKTNAIRWMNAAKVVDDASPVFGEDLLMNMGVGVLEGIQRLPTDAKVEVLCEAEETGKAPTASQVAAVAQKPETKLTKAQELLAAARARRDEAQQKFGELKDDPDVGSRDAEYVQTRKRLDHSEARVTELEEQVEEFRQLVRTEKAKSESEAKARASAEAELEALKFDDEFARAQRVKRIQSTLTIQIPQLMGDIQKYRAERDHYDEAYRDALDTLIKDLQSYLSEYSV